MPNRIIGDGIAKSERISNLNDFQFRLWVHLLTYVDDYGRGDARPAIIKGACFPFRDRMTNRDIEKGLAELADAGCVGLYIVDGKPYLYLPNWEKHQRVRTKVSKCPAPEAADTAQDQNECSNLPQAAADCCRPPQIAARIQNPESRIQNPESGIQNPPAQAREADFERFWAEYPVKVGKQKAKAAFSKASVSVDTLINAIQKQKRSAQWEKDGGQYIPHPATWLNGKRWEDELPMSKDTTPHGNRALDKDELASIRRAMGLEE